MLPPPRGAGRVGLGTGISTMMAFALGVSLTLNINSYLSSTQPNIVSAPSGGPRPDLDGRGSFPRSRQDESQGLAAAGGHRRLGGDSSPSTQGAGSRPLADSVRSPAAISEDDVTPAAEGRGSANKNELGMLRTERALDAMKMIAGRGVPMLKDRMPRGKADIFSSGLMPEGMQEALEEKIGIASYADLRIVTPSLPRTFLMAITPYPSDDDIIGMNIYYSGVFASCESVLFHHLLLKLNIERPPNPFRVPYPPRMPRDPADTPKYFSKNDEQAEGPRRRAPLVVDVGMNMGYFTLMSATYGARTVSIDANPHVIPYVSASVLLNDFSRAVKLIHAGVTNSTKNSIELSTGVWAGARTSTDEVADEETMTIPAKRIDDILNEDVYIFKMDIEAGEHLAMEGALGFLDRHRVDHIILEVQSDMNWFFKRMLQKGYTIFKYSEIYGQPMNSESCWDHFEECFSRCLPQRSPEYDGMTGDFFFTKDKDFIAMLDRLEAAGPPDIMHQYWKDHE